MTRTFIAKRLFIVTLFVVLSATAAFAQGTGFSFQGRLNDGTIPANGRYDLQFSLFNGITGGTQIGSTIARPNTVLINGVFSVSLDFGANAFNSPNAVFIEIGVKPNASPNAFTILGPRQQLTVVPFAIRATIANNALEADYAIDSAKLGGLPSSSYIQSANAGFQLIRNTNTRQEGADFNISGNGVIGGTLNVASISSVGGTLNVAGNITQPPGKNGLAKAMVFVNPNGSIVSCYNAFLNSTTGTCGFVVTRFRQGEYGVDFNQTIGFFVSVTAYSIYNAGFLKDGTNAILVFTNDAGLGVDSGFSVIVF
jgi:hypothetical protein